MAASWLVPSNFLRGRRAWDFFSAFFPSAIALQRAQGCFPSKVRCSATGKDDLQRLPTSIVVQAIGCRKPQCRPIEQASAAAINTLGKRWNTEQHTADSLRVKFRTAQNQRTF